MAWTYGCVGCRDRLSLPVFLLFVFLCFSLLAAGSFLYRRLCRGLVVLLVTGSMIVSFFPSGEREVRTAGGGGLPWWSVGFGFVEHIGINLLLENKIWFFVRSFGEKPNSFFLYNITNVFMIFGSLNSNFFSLSGDVIRVHFGVLSDNSMGFFSFFFFEFRIFKTLKFTPLLADYGVDYSGQK